MNGVPATIVIRHLMSESKPTSRRPAYPSRTSSKRTSAKRTA